MDGNEQLNKIDDTSENVKVVLETAADKESEILDEASDMDFNDAVEITADLEIDQSPPKPEEEKALSDVDKGAVSNADMTLEIVKDDVMGTEQLNPEENKHIEEKDKAEFILEPQGLVITENFSQLECNEDKEIMKDESSNNKKCFGSLETTDQITNEMNDVEVLKVNEEDIELQMRQMHGEMESDDSNNKYEKSLSDTRSDILVAFDPKGYKNTDLKSNEYDGSNGVAEFELGHNDKNIKDFTSNGDDTKLKSNENKGIMNEENAIKLKDKEDNPQEKIRDSESVFINHEKPLDRADKSKNDINKDAWKIDYIRVENQTENNLLHKSSKSSKTSSSGKKRKLDKERSSKSTKRKKIRIQCLPKSVIIGHKKSKIKLDSTKDTLHSRNFDSIYQSRSTEHSLLTKELISTKGIPRTVLNETDTSNKCPSCGDAYHSPAAFFQHIYRKSVDINFDCKQCKKMLNFSNKCLLGIHVIAHSEVDKDTIVAVEDVEIKPHGDESGVLLNNQNLLSLHRRTSKEINFLSNKCMECLETFYDGDAVRLHMLGLGSGRKTLLGDDLSCDVCKKSFATSCALTAHKRLHTKKAPYICPECGQEFLTWEVFRKHVIETCFHDARCIVFICPRCPEFSSPSLGTATDHLITYHTTTLHLCQLCKRAFKCSSQLSSHFNNSHKQTKMNEESVGIIYRSLADATQLFKDKLKLKHHLELEYNYDAIFGYSCHKCEEHTLSISQFREHINNSSCQQSRSNTTTSSSAASSSSWQESESSTADRFLDLSDRMRQHSDSEKCKGCIKHGRNFLNHIDKHHIEIEVAEKVKADVDKNAKPSGAVAVNDIKLPKLMIPPCEQYKIVADHNSTKAKFMSEDIRETRNMRKEKEIVSTAIKMKIKILSPDISKPTSPSLENIKKSEEKSTKVKFTEAKKPKLIPSISTLGIDMPSQKEIIIHNQIENVAAFIQGSTVKSDVSRIQTLGPCRVCGRTSFKDKIQFQAHIQVHRTSDPAVVQCKECGTCFASEPSWRRHLVLIHGIKTPDPDMFCADLNLPDLEPNLSDREAVEVNEEWIINKDSTETPFASNDPSDDEKEEDDEDEESSIIHMEEEESQIDFMEVVDDNDFLDNNDVQDDVAADDDHVAVQNSVLENEDVQVDVADDDNHGDEDTVFENDDIPVDVAFDDNDGAVQDDDLENDDAQVVNAADDNGDYVQDNGPNNDVCKDKVLDNENVSNQVVDDYASENCVENNVNIKEANKACNDNLKGQDSSKNDSSNFEEQLNESIEFKHNIIDPAAGDYINESIGIKGNNINRSIQDDFNDEQSQMVIDTDPISGQGSINCSTNQNIVDPAIKVDNSIIDISNNLVPASDDLIKDLDYTNSGNLTLSSSSLQNEHKELFDGAIEDLDTSETKDSTLEEDIDFLNSSGESLGLGEGTDTLTDAQKKFIAANEAFMKANETVNKDKVDGMEVGPDDFEDSDSESGRLVIDT